MKIEGKTYIENRKFLAIEKARYVNNYIDCDYIQSKIVELEKCELAGDLPTQIDELAHAIFFKTGETKITKMLNDYASEAFKYTQKESEAL